jgi:hypothetical protein
VGHIVTDGYVTVPTAVDGGVAHVDIQRGAILPADVPAEHVEALLARGAIAATDAEPEQASAVADPDAVPAAAAAEVLAWVDGNKDRAAKALEVEQAKGEQARKGLTAELTKLVEPASPPAAPAE